MGEPRDTARHFVDAARQQAIGQPKTEQVTRPREQAQTIVPGTIVPDEVTPRPGQVTESQFLDMIANRVASAAMRSQMWTEAASRVREGYFHDVRALLEELRGQLLRSASMPDHWLRTRLGIPDGAPLTPEDLMKALLGLVDWERLGELEGAIDQLSDEESGDRFTGEGDGSFLTAATMGDYLAPAMGCGGAPPPPGSIPSNKFYGRDVHLKIQEDYRQTHKEHIVLFDSRVYYPGGGSETVRPMGQGKPGHSADLALLDYALTMTSMTGRKRPDILNLTTREIYEIKPRSQVVLGLAQLDLLYRRPLNFALEKVLPKLTGLRADPFIPGLCREWQPLPTYHVRPDLIATTCWDPFSIPGLIIYDLFRVRQPVRVRVPSEVFVLAAAMLAAVIILLDPVPGDEVLLPALAPALKPLLAL